MYLKSYECHYCDTLCKPHVFGELFNPGLCVNCGRFACGECQFIFKIEHPEKKPGCVEDREECDYITRFFGVLDYLLEFAPDEELKLLDLEKWSPLWCDRCEGAITKTRPLGFINKFSCVCLGCTGRNPVNFRKNAAISTLTKLIDEVRTYFADVNVADVKVKSSAMAKCTRKLFILQSMKCEYCGVLDSFRNISKTGGFVCARCIHTEKIDHFDLAFNKIGLNFYKFRIYISNPSDLELLSYSKWSPLKCEECSKHFTVKRNPHFHTSCSKIICKQCTESHQCREKDAQMLPLNFLINIYKEFLCFFRDCPSTLDLHRLRNKLLTAPTKSAQSSSRPNTAKAGAGTLQANLNSESEPEPALPMQPTALDKPKRIVPTELPSAPTTPVVNQVNVKHPTPPVLPEQVTTVGVNNKRPSTLVLRNLRNKLLAAPIKSAQSSSRPNTAKARAGASQANLNSESEPEPALPMQPTAPDKPKRIVPTELPSAPTTPVVNQVNVKHPTPPVLPEQVTTVGVNNKRPSTLDLPRLRNKLLTAPTKSAQSSSRPNTAKAGAGTLQANFNSESEPEPALPMQPTALDKPKRIVPTELPSAPTTPVVNHVNVKHPTPPVLPEQVTTVGVNNKLDERRTSTEADQPRTCADCGGVVDVKAFNLCFACPMKCVCQDCIIIHHWNLGHQIQKSGPAELTAVAYSEHSNMVKKMDNWKIRIDYCYEQGTDAHKTLHTTFNNVCTTAMRANPRGTLPSAELDQLNQSIENTCKAHAALVEEIRTLSQRCDSVGAAFSGTASTAAGGN